MFIYVMILTHLMIIVDRYRLMQGLSRISTLLTSLGVWMLSLFLVLPYQPYISYIDLEKYLGTQFHHVGICTASITGYVKQYTRALVQVMYFAPVCMMSCLYLRMHRDLQRRRMYWDVVYETRTSLDSVSSPTTCR
ncbi:hypothetical protein J6590_015982 [Homalodisca vitripennis]|nr:hypothetical protein J6590_015982 [Homalodisca vitripennis]